MPEGKFRSRTYRRIFVRTPGSRTVMHYRRRKPSKAVCGTCKTVLAGVPQGLPYVIAKFPRSARRPERPYGGNLCSACTRKLLKDKARSA